VQTDADGPGDASAEDPAASDPATTVAAPAAAAALAAARVDDADGDDDDPASTLVVRTIPPDMPEPEGSHQAIIETLRGMEEWSAEHPAVAAKLARDVRTIPEDTAPTRERDAAKEAEARRESETPAATREGRRPGALPTPGDRVEGYEIIEEVGRGGMGRVYRARHRITEQEVALKMILPRYAEDPRQRRRFINEARVIAQLEHPNLVPLLGFVESESKTFIVMPFVRGVTLERLLRRQGRLELDAALDIFGQMCDAIQHVHSNDVLHRDLKPSNVIVREDGRVMVTDFGIARAVGSQRLTMTGMVVGTAEYVAPEHATGTVRDDPRSDIYALGVLLYEMVAGQVPFHHPNPAEVLRRHVSDEPPPLTTVVQGLSRAIEAAALKALEKDPADRYETAADFKRAVSRAHVHDEAPPRRRRRPVEPQRPRAGLPGGASVAIDPEPTDVVRRASEPSPPATTPGIAVWAAVIFFCAAAGISAWVLFRW
jgi:serine/threonine protein kinase